MTKEEMIALLDEKIENKNLCHTCGGMCCIHSGCVYSPLDFEKMSASYLNQRLEEGNLSITSILHFIPRTDGKLILHPVLVLRVRNQDRPVVDLFSPKTTCAVLTETGCPYPKEERPTGALLLIPKKKDGEFCCETTYTDKKAIEDWKPYQNILRRLVKKYTGKSAEKVLDQQIETTLSNVLIKRARTPYLLTPEDHEFLETLNLLQEVNKKQVTTIYNKAKRLSR